MPALRNQRHERFAVELAKGCSQTEAAKRAGYKGSRFHASRLATKSNIKARVAELEARTAEKVTQITAMDRAWVLEELRANLERHKETNGAVANRALELIGKELGLFINRKDITHHKKDDLDDMNEKELAIEQVRVAQLLLASYEEDEETENNDGE